MESWISVRLRQVSALVALVAVPVAIISGLAGRETTFTIAALTFFALPWSVLIIHLSLLASPSAEDKALWRRELSGGSTGAFIALWAYLCSSDWPRRARQFGPYRRDRIPISVSPKSPAT